MSDKITQLSDAIEKKLAIERGGLPESKKEKQMREMSAFYWSRLIPSNKCTMKSGS